MSARPQFASRRAAAPAPGSAVSTPSPAAAPGRAARGARRGTGFLPAAALLALLCALQLLAVLRSPPAWMPERITVHLARGAQVVLGPGALGAPEGAGQQLRLRRDAGGLWWIADAGTNTGTGTGAGPSTAIRLLAAGRAWRTGSVALVPGQAFQVGAMRFAVTDADAHGVRLAAGGVRWRYDGALLRRAEGRGAEGVPDACPDARIGTRIAALWNRIAPAPLAVQRPLVFGGNLDCGNRIAIAGMPAPAAHIARTDDGLVLSGAAPVLFQPAGGDGSLLAQREEPLGGRQAIVVGRTRLALGIEGDRLHLHPASHVALYGTPEARLPDSVAWDWVRRAPWTLAPGARSAALDRALPVAAGAILSLALLALVWPALRSGIGSRPRPTLRTSVQRDQYRWPALLAWRPAAAVLLAGAGLALLVLQRLGAAPGPGVALVVGWGALWFLLAGWGGALACRAGTLLLALGLLAQLDLGLGAPESSWLRHAQKSAAILALGVGALELAAAWARPAMTGARGRWSQAGVERLLLVLAGLALAALLLQVVFGDETGVFDLQPVEFAKLALAALTSHCLALESGSGMGQATWRRWLLTLAPCLLFGVLLAVALVQVDDYSPLVLLCVWAGTLALAHALATGRRLPAALLAAGAAGAVLAVALLHGADVARIGQGGFYTDRFLVWLDPGAHPHTGAQVLRGARAIAAGGWWGEDGFLGLAALGRDPGLALGVPAVQDDFAIAFFLQRHGLAGGLLLWGLQALFLGGLLHLALRCWRAAPAAGDFRGAWLARLRCFLLVGGAAFAFGHFLLSWGTNLAILPVMGQPMSFLSAGGSHLLFFICPLLCLASTTSHTFEENDDAGLRPT